MARKKRFGPAWISASGHEPGLLVLYPSEFHEGIRKWCIVGEDGWRIVGANTWYIVGEDHWYKVGANAWYIMAEDYWYIVVRGVTDGRWVARITIGTKRLEKYGKTQKEVRDWLKETRDQVEKGLTYTGAKATVREYMTGWLESVKPALRPKTWEQYEQVVRIHLEPIHKLKLKDLRPDHIQSVYSLKRQEGKGEHTIRIIHAVLHKALSEAVKWGVIPRNPTDLVVKPKPQKKEMKALTVEQAQSLLSLVKETRWYALYYLSITTGLRQGELLGLKWIDVDWLNGNLSVKRQVQRVDKKLAFVEPKTSSSIRSVNIGPDGIDVLRKHLAYQQLERQFAKRWVENDLIFPTTVGTLMNSRNLIRQFHSDLERARLPKIRFHDLRHTAASFMLSQGVHPKVVQERLGHSSIRLTLDTYSHVLPHMQGEAARLVEEMLRIETIEVKNEQSP